MTPKSQGVTTVTVFQTTDGQQFNGQREADAHQLGLNRRRAILDFLKSHVPQGRADTTATTKTIADFLYFNIGELNDLTDRMRAAGLVGKDRRADIAMVEHDA